MNKKIKGLNRDNNNLSNGPENRKNNKFTLLWYFI